MISFSDAITLVFTKLRSHKVRTLLGVILASLLFGILVASSLVVTGAFRSAARFSEDGLSSRYIVSISESKGSSLNSTVFTDNTLISQAKVKYAQLIKEKTAEAKRLGITYDSTLDQPPYNVSTDGKERLVLNDKNGITRSVLKEKYGNEPSFDIDKLEARLNGYGNHTSYAITTYSLARGSSLSILPDGKETFYDTSNTEEANKYYKKPILDTSFSLAPDGLIESFMLPNNGGWNESDGTLPIILPQNVLEQLLGLEELPTSASTGDKLNRISILKERSRDFGFKACYRNSASLSLIQQTITQQKEIDRLSKLSSDFVAPALQYGLPNDDDCANPSPVKDARTTNEKSYDQNQQTFDEKFGLYERPESYFVTFKVVGISPAVTDSPVQIESGMDIITSLLQTSRIGQAIPFSLYNKIEDKSKYNKILSYEPLYLFGPEDNITRFAEFSSAESAKKFIKEEGCTVQHDSTCRPTGRDYIASLAFSNSVAIDDVRSNVDEWFDAAAIVIIALAAIIMSITVGRTITDGRHETAVFRAVGFKRIDISLIYTMYTFTLSLFVAILAGIIGLIGAYVVNILYAPQLTAQAQYAFGELDSSKEMSLLGFNVEQLTVILLACLLTGLLSATIPLIRNVQRSPIRDMRDDS